MRASANSRRCKEYGANGCQCNLPLNHAEEHDFKSTRKPHNDEAGYIASLRSGKNRGWIAVNPDRCLSTYVKHPNPQLH